MSQFQPPPTYADPFIAAADGKSPPRFNPIWLKWFLDLVQNIPQAGAGGGTVESVSVTSANGVSGSVATPTTLPALTLALGAITPTTVQPSSNYKAADGTTGLTSTQVLAGQTITIKNGLVVGLV